ncbi:DUF1330 domain-containing protein [Arthrobacter sp. AET 35A]|uniref:DUF1330 domain-containing protein n=1 Tax=Arthrobacter sp. AET 35A TaxID=2292643 RepID=UPI0017814A7F|nr:DUF1330 domain-containing protein [Arthrobacter sp. AET 35A]MBE0011272.1 DUF1330 domain-containing protein [Arthrobacter sp. AET 35A]
MSAYVIMLRERVTDPDELDVYAAAARPARVGRPITPVVSYGAITTLEGTPLDGILVNEFPTVEDALAWYNSPAYQAAIPHRQAAADYRVLIIQGVN